MAITMQDVARYAAVSVATVSRAINSPDQVNEETRQRVFDAVSALGYRLNNTARSLRTQRTHNLAILFSSMMYATFVEEIETVALEYGYTLTLCTTHDDPARTATYIDLLQEQRVDGICWVSPRITPEILAPLLDGSIPVLLINAMQDEGLFAFNYEAAVAEATRHLLRQGHQRIALLNLDDPDFLPAQWRESGFRRAFQVMGASVSEALIRAVPADLTQHQAWITEIEQILRLPQPPTAIVAYNDIIAAQVYQVCYRLGLSIPQDVAVAGAGDFPIAQLLHPPLTTTRFPIEKISRHAIELLLEWMREGAPTKAQTVYFAPELVIRPSTA